MRLAYCGAAAFVFWLAHFDQAHAEQRMVCPGEAIALDTAKSQPFVRMRLGAKEGNFLIDTGSDHSFVNSALYKIQPGEKITDKKITITGSSLPTLDSGSFYAVDLSWQVPPFAPPGGTAGILGTDILATRTVEFHYESASPYMVVSAQHCSPSVFENAGFVSIAQTGYGATRFWVPLLWSLLHGRLDVVQRTNLPLIYARIGSVRMPLWFDTGTSEENRHMELLINGPIMDQLRAAGIAMRSAGTRTNTDCENHQNVDSKWQVDSEPLVLETETGSVLFEYGPPDLVVGGKSRCGTIGNHVEPVGLLGALFLPRFGTVIFDGPNQRVWLPKPGAVVPAPDAFRAMAFSRHERGAWLLTTDETLDNARESSLKSCNSPQGGCRLEVAIDASNFACLAVAKKPNVGMAEPASGTSLVNVRSAALAACTKTNGSGCVLAYSGCND
jgi:hypothetical protein